jgi:serine/threonine protein kinase
MQDPGSTRYRDIILLGRGGMGDVTLAVLQGPSGFSKLKVIKRLRSEIADKTEFLQMFLHEARLAARLSHPNIVQTNEVGRDGEFYFIAMEYLEGQTLHAIFRRSRPRTGAESSLSSGPLSEPTPLSGSMSVSLPSVRPLGESTLSLNIGLRIISDTLEGLHYAHEMKDDRGQPMRLVHRDVSPGNIFIAYDGAVKLLDFGIAKAADSDMQTRTGILKGKVPYMAPEQFRSRNVDRRCDVYAVGAILWELAAGARLWHGLSDIEIVSRLSAGGAPSPRTVNPDVHPQLERICMKALAMNADDRYSTAAELQADVEGLLRLMGGATSRAVGKYVSSLFAQKRAQQQSVIESKLREFRQQHGLKATGDESGPRMGMRPTSQSGEFGVPSHPTHTGDYGPRFSQSVQTAASRSTTGGITAPSPDLPPPPRARVLPWVMAGSALITAVAVGSVYWALHRPASGNPPVSPPTSAAPRTHLVVQASPADATLYLDNAPLMTNPFIGDVPRDGLSHSVRAEANGFSTETRLATFGGPVEMVRLDLKRVTPDGK